MLGRGLSGEGPSQDELATQSQGSRRGYRVGSDKWDRVLYREQKRKAGSGERRKRGPLKGRNRGLKQGDVWPISSVRTEFKDGTLKNQRLGEALPVSGENVCQEEESLTKEE
jgi:hypothetical protein